MREMMTRGGVLTTVSAAISAKEEHRPGCVGREDRF
jgi:hypothetical protein